jgi:hypothetical protein
MIFELSDDMTVSTSAAEGFRGRQQVGDDDGAYLLNCRIDLLELCSGLIGKDLDSVQGLLLVLQESHLVLLPGICSKKIVESSRFRR